MSAAVIPADHPAMHTLVVSGGSPTPAGGVSPTDVAGSLLGLVTGISNWLNSLGNTFADTSPSRSDYQTTVLTIVVIGMLFALLLVSAGTVVRVATAVKA